MKSWKGLFREHILERGYYYFRSGVVTDVSSNAKGCHAIVEGSEEYEVDIELHGEEFGKMYCTCPYAEGGSYCKHMAAVLYYLEQDKQVLLEIVENHNPCQEMQSLLNKITETEVKEFLLKLADEDSSIANRIIATFSKSPGKNEVAQLKKEVDDIVYRYAGREGFIYYREAYDFINEIENFLYEKGQALIDNECNMQAFEVVSYVFQIIGNQDMDDSDGGTGNIANLCYDLWEQILEQSYEEEKKELFRWFQSHQEGYVIDFMEEYITDFLMNHFHDRDMLLQKLEQLDEHICAAEGKMDCGKSWSVRYGYENNILKRLELMRLLGLSEAEVKAYRKKFRNFSAVRKLEIDESIKNKDYDSAIALLTESKELDKEYPGLVSGYSTMLIELYQKLHLNEQYKQELIFQVFQCRQDNLDYVKKLKQCCPEEWEDTLEKLLHEPTMLSLKYQLLEAEGLYKRLLDEILNGGFIYSLDQYEKSLKKSFPNEVRDAYVNFVIHRAESTADRKAYKELVKYLKKICKYPYGKETVLKIAEEWRASYRRRPAMLDELKKAGF